jgi:hypothetical protein
VVRPTNPVVPAFRERVTWIVENLDSDPTYARFVSEPNDVFSTLTAAIDRGDYAIASDLGENVDRRTRIDVRTWNRALQTGKVSPVLLHWLCDLFPDLTLQHLLTPDTDAFNARCDAMVAARQAWDAPARLYAKERRRLESAAMRFYRDVQWTGLDDVLAAPFPLLVRPGWIRGRPLRLDPRTEASWLKPPGAIRPFPPLRLEGLAAPYVTYRGKLGFPRRRVVRREAQHNGEIFTVAEVLAPAGEFVGFDYDTAFYFDYLNTCEILGAELARRLIEGEEISPDSDLPLRGRPQDAFDFSRRAAYPGVNCLTILLGYGDKEVEPADWVLLHKRDETQLQAQNTLHVVPAGGHQGFAKGSLAADTALWRTLAREFAEELFNEESVSRQSENWADFNRHPGVQKIVGCFFEGPEPAARVYLHGFGLDPVTLKPEVLCTMVIDWPRAARHGMKLKFNWELQTGRVGETRHQWAEFTRETLVRTATQQIHSYAGQPLNPLPAGAACMLLTAHHLPAMGLA